METFPIAKVRIPFMFVFPPMVMPDELFTLMSCKIFWPLTVWLAEPENSTVPVPVGFGKAFSLARFFLRIRRPSFFMDAPLATDRLSIETRVLPGVITREVPLVTTLPAIAGEEPVNQEISISARTAIAILPVIFIKLFKVFIVL